MTKVTRKISIRLDASLHDKLQELAKVHPGRSMTTVIEKMVTAGLSDATTAVPQVYLEAAIANLAVIINLLRRVHHVDPEALELAGHFYGILLELTIAIQGVEP